MKKVLDHGFIELVDFMGDDYRILQAARVSTGGEAKKGDARDRGLLRYLLKNGHTTPFEQAVFTFHVKAPIFVLRQWFRHRTWSFNEYSGRYSEMINDAYIPEQFYYQSEQNHQGSGSEVTSGNNEDLRKDLSELYHEEWTFYKKLVNMGIAKEQARVCLPVGQYSEFYGTIDLHNLFKFLSQRMDSHAQYEIRVFAEEAFRLLKDTGKFDWSIAAFEEFQELYTLYNEVINLSKKDTSKLKEVLGSLKNELSNI